MTTKTATPEKPATSRGTKSTPAKKAKTKKTSSAKPTDKPSSKSGKLSALDAAAKLLARTKEPMTCRELVEAMAAKNLWKSPGGKTPHATIYSAILREIQSKGKDARFKKTERGRFATNG